MTIFAVGGEDEAFTNVGGCGVSTTAATFNATRARCSLYVPVQTSGPQAQYWAFRNQFSLTSFWATVECSSSDGISGTNGAPENFFLIRFLDSSGIVRLRLIASGGDQVPMGNWTLQKVNAAGTATTLATSTDGFMSSGEFAGAPLNKFDFQIDYATSGQFVWYVSGIPVLSIAGDMTTDGVTALAGIDLGQGALGTNGGATTYWSELIVADVDTRSVNLYTLPPTGAGASSSWNGASNGSTVNETTLNDADGIDTTGTAEIELFTQAGTLAGPFITAVAVSARVITSSGQPQHVDMMIRQNGTNYASADLAAGTSFGNVQNIWANDPNTGLPWASITGTQIGVGSKA